MSTVVYPQDKSAAGVHYWNVLFNTAAQYPQYPTRDDKVDTHNFIKSTIKRFTCADCIESAFAYMRKHPAELDNRQTLMRWLCGLKNDANTREGKEVINCDDFIKNSLNSSDDAGCKTCQIETIKAPSVNITPPKPVIAAQATIIPKQEMDSDFESVWNWRKRYPSVKRSINIEEEKKITMGDDESLESKYPSLAGFESEFAQVPKEEEMDGLLKPLDSLYALPANIMGIKPYEFNLAYTPEMLTNTVTLLTQMYFTNFGSLLTTLLSSVSLLGISLFAKNSLSHYDRLFVQNVTGSMLFHALNFVNPRGKDEILSHIGTFVEGLTTMNFDKIKEAILFGHAEAANKGADDLMEMLDTQNGIIDVDKMTKKGYSARDIQNASQFIGMGNSPPADLRTVGGSGFNGTGGAMSKDEIARLFEERRNQSNYKRGATANYDVLGAADDKFSYILDNNLL